MLISYFIQCNNKNRNIASTNLYTQDDTNALRHPAYFNNKIHLKIKYLREGINIDKYLLKYSKKHFY